MELKFEKQTIALSGRFEGFSKGELDILVRARGAWQTPSSPNKQTAALFSAEGTGKKVDKARALGVPVVLEADLRATLGPPLGGFRERFERFFAARPDYYRVRVQAIGDPAPPEALAAAEARIGFPLPEVARNLWSQLDGMSILWTTRHDHETPKGYVDPPTERQPIPWNLAADECGPYWAKIREWRGNPQRGSPMGLICIPPIAEIFGDAGDLFTTSHYTAKDTVKIGRRKLNAHEFHRQLFLFDAFHGFYQAALWADPERQELFVVYGEDHAANWAFADAIPLEVYMEGLIVDWGASRMISLNSKRGATQATRNYAHRPYWLLEPYG